MVKIVKLNELDQKRMKKLDKEIKIKEQYETELEKISWNNKKPLNYVLDTNIIYKIYNDNTGKILDKLVEHANGKGIIFNVVGKVSHEFIDLQERKDKENNKIQKSEIDIKEILKGEVRFLRSKKGTDVWNWALDFSHNKYKEYAEKGGKKPDVVDCLSLKYYLDNISWELVTNDKQLKEAARKEGNKRNREENIFDPLIN